LKFFFLIGVSLFLSLFGWGQHFYSRNFTVNDGLPSNLIHSIYKDSRGMMWIGTGSGLCQFDGEEFKVLGSGKGLAGYNVFSITEDDQGNIWAGCMKGGVFCCDGKNFTTYTTKQGLVSDNVRVVWFSKKFHLLFIGTNDGCSVFDGKSFVSLTTKDTGTPDFYVMGFLDGGDYINIYPFLPTSPYRYYPATKKFVQTKDSYYPSHITSTSPVIMPNGDTIMGSIREGINVLNNGIKQSFKGMGQVFDIKPGETGVFWVAAWSESPLSKEIPGGLFSYDGKTVYRYSEKVGINDPAVWCVFYDTTFHVLWAGTLNSGIFKIPLPAFEWYAKEDFGLKELNVKALFVNTDNTLWVGLTSGLFNRNMNGDIKIYDSVLLRNTFKSPKSSPLGCYCVQKDKRGNIYSSGYESPIIRFSPADNFEKPKSLKENLCGTQFCFDSYDSVYHTDKWMAGVYQTAIYPKTSPTKLYWSTKNDALSYVVKLISSGDTIWYCSKTEGLFCSLHGKFGHLIKTDSTSPRMINDICFDREGNVIAGSNSGEVLIVRYENNSLKVKYRLQPGKDIIGNTVKFVVVDHAHHLFVGTNLGLNRIDLQSLYKSNEVLTNFYTSDVGYYDHTGKTATTDMDGNIWVGTDCHLLKIDTKLLNQLSNITPQIKITGLDVNYQPFPDFENTTYFSHFHNNLIFHFESANYLNPEQSLYRYKLEGLSDRWSDFTLENKSMFTSLNPGKYCLIVESYNTIDNSKVGMTKHTFRIGYPWYLTWWFIVGMIVTLGLLVWFFIRYRTEKIREEEKQKSQFSKQLAEIEMKALQSQMNPHFIFNSINSIQGFILKNKVDEALGYLMDFSKILRQTLDNATKEYISLDEEIEYIKWYLNLELMRFDKKFTVEFRLPDNLNPQYILIPPMVVQPFVENAIRHGLLHKSDGQGLLLIEFVVQGDQQLKCIIEDNGVGRKRSKEIESWKNQTTHKPQSTRITKDRIDLLNKASQSDKYRVNIVDLCDGKGTGTGTRVEIVLPLMTI